MNQLKQPRPTHILPMRDWGGLRIPWMVFGFEQKIYKRDMLRFAVVTGREGEGGVFWCCGQLKDNTKWKKF